MLDVTMLERLKAQFPLFEWKDGAEGVFVAKGAKDITITVTELDNSTLALLKKEHDRLQAINELRGKYPHLFFTPISEGAIQLSVRRDNTEGEAVGTVQNAADPQIGLLNAEAEKAASPDGFFCFGCKKAKPKAEYAQTTMRAEFCLACSTERKGAPPDQAT